MPNELSAYDLAASLVGRTLQTISHRKPNIVLSVSSSDVIVATEQSPDGEPVQLAKLQHGLDLLFATGSVRIEPDTFDGYRRSSFIGAALSTLHGVEVDAHPVQVRLAEESPLADSLRQICELTGQERQGDVLSQDEPLYSTVVVDGPSEIRKLIADDSYLVKGSAGQRNFPWAETVWISVFDRMVTESAQRGYYVVYLFRRDGGGFYLSLNQGGTFVSRPPGTGRVAALGERAARYRTHISHDARATLGLTTINLGGSQERTRWYEAGNVLGRFYPYDSLPHDAVLTADLRTALRLYATVVEGEDEREAEDSPDLPGEAKTGTESRRFRWHLRAEGRNHSIAAHAKRLARYTCEICARNFEDELGAVGRRCIDAHHLAPFKDLDERPREIRPTSFAVVCANCHRLLHSKTPPLLPAEVRELIAPSDLEATTGIEPV